MSESITKEVPAHVGRMIEEMDQLTERVGKLREFIKEDVRFWSLTKYERDLMKRQDGEMSAYLVTLTDRIDYATRPKGEHQHD